MNMSRPEFKVNISKTGEVTVEIKGAKGPSCLAYADLIKEIVGEEISRKLTSEYYAPDGKVRIDSHVSDSFGR